MKFICPKMSFFFFFLPYLKIYIVQYSILHNQHQPEVCFSSTVHFFHGSPSVQIQTFNERLPYFSFVLMILISTQQCNLVSASPAA